MACCYKVSFNGNLLYIGSTFDFKNRVWKHKTAMKNEKLDDGTSLYKYVRENDIDINKLIFEKIETECESKDELRRAEGLLIRQLKPICNKLIAGRTKKEYVEDNKEEILEKAKIYREKNKEERVVYDKLYYETNKVEISKKQKERYGENKQEILQQKKEYYEKNKDEINKKKKEYYDKNREALLNQKKEYHKKIKKIELER